MLRLGVGNWQSAERVGTWRNYWRCALWNIVDLCVR